MRRGLRYLKKAARRMNANRKLVASCPGGRAGTRAAARIGFSVTLAGLLSLGGNADAAVTLVEKGKAVGVVVLSENPNALVEEAARVFVRTVEKSTGAVIPIISEQEAAQLDEGKPRMFLGPCQANLAKGLDPFALEPDSYHQVVSGNAIYLIGAERVTSRISDDGRPVSWVSRPTLWALNRMLEEQLQVRWIWPGDLGTVIPKHETLTVQDGDLQYQAKLQLRSLRFPTSRPLVNDPEADIRIKQEAGLWAEGHGVGRRGVVRFGHAFGHWWAKYSKDHPDYFAYLGKIKQPYLKPSSVKLRLSNPAVIEAIAQEYIEAGSPNFYNVCPNDGSGFDIHPDTLAWDLPRDQPPRDIIRARGELTARYVKFWNLLYARLAKINPDVVLTTYAYSSYRNPPPPERPLTARAIFGIVASYDSYDLWKGWSKYAEGLYLRPNWWHLGADAPYMPMEETYNYIKFAWENGMLGIDMDSLLGYWGTQGPVYYMVARLMTRPELTLDEIIAEYTSAFGKGAPKIREYIAYWQKITTDYDYPINGAKDMERVNKPGHKYFALVREGKVAGSILKGATDVLPYLYGDAVLEPGEHLLDEAEQLIGEDDPEAKERVAFLRKGLVSLRATRDQVARGYLLKTKGGTAAMDNFVKGAEELQKLRLELGKESVLWDYYGTHHENAYKVLIRPENLGHYEINLDGQ